jgi:hypothetical protein
VKATRDRDVWAETWLTGPYDANGLVRADIEHGYTHMIRASDDPERSDRSVRGGRGRDDDAETRVVRKVHRMPAAEARAKILELVADGEPRTFNRICVELWDITADIAGPAITRALFDLVEEKRLQHTNEAPILWLPVWQGDDLPPKLPRRLAPETNDGQLPLAIDGASVRRW